MSRFGGYSLRFLFLSGILLAAVFAGCSDDETVSEPVEVPDPSSYVWQINALPDGTAFAAGAEGREGRLYTNHTGVWAPHDIQVDLVASGEVTGLDGVLPISMDDLYVFALPAEILHLEGDQWISQPMDLTLSCGFLEQTPSGLWCLGSDGTLLRQESGEWNTVLDFRESDSILADIVESPDGTVFVSQFFHEQDIGRVHRISSGGVTASDDLNTPVYALAATATDTVWAAGTRLARFAEATWDTVVSIPDSNLVVAIGQPGDGSLTLICEMGAVFSWRNEVLTTVQEFNQRAPLASVCYIDDTTIFGSLNYTDENTGHDMGIIVRFDGTQWIPVFLAPPALR